MTKSSQLLKEGRAKELWDKHCGYLELSLQEYMEIQKRLLMENIQLLSTSTIGKHFLGDPPPRTVDEFRERVPITTYEDYEQFLGVKNEDVLPAKPYVWARTSGRTSIDNHKWVPYTRTMYDRLADAVAAGLLMSSSRYPGDVRLLPNDRFLLSTAPPPYISGLATRAISEELDLKFLPPLDIGENMAYGERLALGFKLAMKEGVDYFMGVTSVLARMGEQFQEQTQNSKLSKEMLHPKVLFRLIRALIIAKANNRSILPRDIWKLKGVMSAGTDSNIYREKMEHYWGVKPLEGYACTEGVNMALTAWNYKGMIFFPDSNFLEFIPFEDHLKSQEDPNFVPRTYLYDEVKEGVYELVFTNFHGGVFVRYRPGDLFNFIALKDDELQNELPQARFFSRQQDIIDIGNLWRIAEIGVWQAIEAAEIPYTDWTARKEFVDDRSRLHIYIEPKFEIETSIDDIKCRIDQYFTDTLQEYRDLKQILGYDPLIVSWLPIGAFSAYMAAKQAAGADLAHIKPPHIQANDKIMGWLLGFEKKE